MLWTDSIVSRPYNYYPSLAHIEILERRSSKDPELRERYADTIREDIKKGHVVTVEPHDPCSRTDSEWYTPHHPVINPNQPGKVCRLRNGAAKFLGTSLNQSLLVGLGSLQNLMSVLFRPHKYAVYANIGYVSPGRIPRPRSIFASFFFVVGRSHFGCGSLSVHSPCIWCL